MVHQTPQLAGHYERKAPLSTWHRVSQKAKMSQRNSSSQNFLTVFCQGVCQFSKYATNEIPAT